jgi:hypothetical protein
LPLDQWPGTRVDLLDASLVEIILKREKYTSRVDYGSRFRHRQTMARDECRNYQRVSPIQGYTRSFLLMSKLEKSKLNPASSILL